MVRVLRVCGVLLCLGIVELRAQYVPSWWLDGTSPVLIPNAKANNYAPANLGQLKWIATRAKAHLDAALASSGGSGTTISTLVAGFQQSTPANYDPINLGQLKAVAKPFYDRLIAVGYNTNLNLIANGYSPLWTGNYPWDPSTPNSANYAPVTLGQLKLVFSFDIVDSNGDGTLDYQQGVYPAASNTRDTDGDGVPDILDAYPNDPTRSSRALVYDPNDHTSPTITITAPVGVTLQ